MSESQRTALVVGASGIVGRNLADHLVKDPSWTVYGLARNPAQQSGVTPVAADLCDSASLEQALRHVHPTHVFYASWLRQPTEAENIRVNGGMVRDLLQALAGRNVQHVALVTGLKHYLGPFESYGKGTLPATPFREEQPRLDVANFYYAQEDEVLAAAERQGFTWSVHRPHTIIGYAVGNAMNMGVTLAVYASICKAIGKPFLFPGSRVQWQSLTDMTDARLLARHLVWASTTDAARNMAFNVVNGDVFRWQWMWQQIASYFGLTPAPFEGDGTPLEVQLQNADTTWRDIASAHNLVEPELRKLVSPWHTDADLGRPVEVLTDMSRSRTLGFLDYQPTADSFFTLFDRLRADRLIP